MVTLRPGRVVLTAFPLLMAMIVYSLKVSDRATMGSSREILNGLKAEIPNWNSTSALVRDWTGGGSVNAIDSPDRSGTNSESSTASVPVASKQATTSPDGLISASDTATISKNDTFSACLLVMDDNFRLREWLAYNYHVLPLRHLIVAVDKRSKLSPTSILDTFRQELGMNIIEWKDADFLKLPNLPVNATPHATRERYLLRQRRFLEQCIEHYYHAGHHWTACYDTDEVVTISPKTQGISFQKVTGRSSFEKPGAVLDYIRKAQALGKKKTQLRDNNCIIVPRTLFGAVETPEDELQKAIPEGLNIEPRRLDTIRWRQHNLFSEKRNGLGKPLIDASRMGPALPMVVRNPHRVSDHLCGPPFFQHTKFCGLRINHYLGSWEQYSYRDDSRKGADRSREVRTCLALWT
jgi:hypothetical protein